jgi:tetratricopeptide (TPR) repeat protein
MYNLRTRILEILIGLVYVCCGMHIDAQENNKLILYEVDSVSTLQDEKNKLIMEAKKLSYEGDIYKAADKYREAIKIDARCDACYYELANILILLDKDREAQENAKTAYNLDPKNTWFALLYGRLCFHFKEFDTARKLFGQILVHHRKKQELWLALASSYEEQGLLHDALGILDSMVIRFGESDDISYRLFNISMEIGNYDKAITEIKKLVTRYPDDPRFATLLAESYSETGKDSLAIKAYDRAISANKAFAPAWLGKAETFRKQGLFSNYFAVLQQYASNKSIDPETKAEYLNLLFGISSFVVHFKSNMDTIFAILSAVHPLAMDLKFLQARYFASTQRPELSLSILGQLTDMDSNNKDAWLGLLSLEYNMRMFVQLEQSSQKAIASDSEYAGFYMYSALALMAQKKIKQAIKIMEKGISKANCDSVFMDNAFAILGDMYFNINKSGKAFDYYEKALSINPQNATVLNNYAYYISLSKSRNLDKAYTMSKKAIELEDGNPSFLDTYAYILFLQGKYAEAKTIFRKALASGGDESAVVLEHYADTLDKLGERTVAETYWFQALDKPDCLNPDKIRKKLKGN